MPFTPPSLLKSRLAGHKVLVWNPWRGENLHLPGTQNLFSSNAARYLVMLRSELPRPTSGGFVRLA